MPGKDDLPYRDADFLAWARNGINYAESNAMRLDIRLPSSGDGYEKSAAPQDAIISPFPRLHEQLTDAEQKYEIATNPLTRTAVAVENKDLSIKALRDGMRAFLNENIRGNHRVTDADRLAMGLSIPKRTHSPIGVPTEIPDMDMKSIYGHRVEVRFHSPTTGNKAIPYGMNGVKIKYLVCDPEAPAPLIVDLKEDRLATHSPFVLQFTDADKGRTVYVSICWENEKGEIGPWHDIQSVVIS